MRSKLWQSWSHAKTTFIHTPHWDTCPVLETAKENSRPNDFELKPKIKGWCSWHAFGKNISEKMLLQKALEVKERNLDYFLIDDGWCTWGDWQLPNPKKLPNGITSLTNKINQLNLKPGIWLAPFLIDPRSQTYKRHPDWVVIDKKNRPINGWKYSSIDHYFGQKKYLLNFENPQAKAYVYESITKLIEHGKIKLLKLDFLYAPYFNPEYKTDEKPHAILVDLFKHIRKNFPSIYVIACGCPYKPAKYLVDAIRISPDINAPQLEKVPLVRWLFFRNRFRHLLANWHSTQHLKKYFHLDPDAILYNHNHPVYQKSNIKLYGH